MGGKEEERQAGRQPRCRPDQVFLTMLVFGRSRSVTSCWKVAPSVSITLPPSSCHPAPLQEKPPRLCTRGTEYLNLVGGGLTRSRPGTPPFHSSLALLAKPQIPPVMAIGLSQARPSANGIIVLGDSPLRFTPRAVASEHEGGNSHARIAFGEAAPHGADVRSPVHDMYNWKYRIPGLPLTFYRPWETDSRRSRGHFRSAEI